MTLEQATVAAQQFLDRSPEFGQTAVSMSQPDGHAEDFARPIPEVIQRHNAGRPFNRTPSIELVQAITERNDALRKLDAAEARIRQFEQFAGSLAEHMDSIEADFTFLTGKNVAEWIAEAREKRQAAAVPTICRSPSPAQNGLVCLRDKGHEGPCSTNPQPPPVNMDLETQCKFYRPLNSDKAYRCQLLEGHGGDHMF